jgi:hypothetical protein
MIVGWTERWMFLGWINAWMDGLFEVLLERWIDT